MSILLLTPVAFIIFLTIAFLIYRVGKVLGVKREEEGAKLESYACGEDIPERGEKVQHSYHFFHFAFFFTILHVAALIIATVPSGSVALLGIVYLVIALIAVIILIVD